MLDSKGLFWPTSWGVILTMQLCWPLVTLGVSRKHFWWDSPDNIEKKQNKNLVETTVVYRTSRVGRRGIGMEDYYVPVCRKLFHVWPSSLFDERPLLVDTKEPLLAQPDSLLALTMSTPSRHLVTCLSSMLRTMVGLYIEANPKENKTRLSPTRWKLLVDINFPRAYKIRVVLTTPYPLLYMKLSHLQLQKHFDHLEFHYIPKHGSWFNQVEIEISVLITSMSRTTNSQCWD